MVVFLTVGGGSGVVVPAGVVDPLVEHTIGGLVGSGVLGPADTIMQ